MDPQRHPFRLGEVVKARLIEQIDQRVWIVDFNGRLLRVTNSTNENLALGQSIDLVVTGVRPLQFSVTSPSAKQRTL